MANEKKRKGSYYYKDEMKKLGLIGIFRILSGITIIGLGFYMKTWVGIIGLLPIFTALTNKCSSCGGNKNNFCDKS